MKELQGDVAVQAVVVRAVNHAHPAFADLLDDSVMGDGLLVHGWESTKASILGCGRKASQRLRGKVFVRIKRCARLCSRTCLERI